MMGRRTGQADSEYGATEDSSRTRGAPLDAATIREKLATQPTIAKRLRQIVESGATASAPLVYDVRAPVGSRPLLTWGCIEIANVDSRIHVWPLPLARDVLECG